MFIVHTY